MIEEDLIINYLNKKANTRYRVNNKKLVIKSFEVIK